MDVDSSMTSSQDLETVEKGETNGVSVKEEKVAEESVGVGGGGGVDEGVQVVSGGGGGGGVGPRHAPNYSVVNAICEKKEDGPGPRCGHTLTSVAAVGEEGSANYMGPRLILFGGATALEGNSANAGTPTSAGGAGIRMFLALFRLLIVLLD